MKKFAIGVAAVLFLFALPLWSQQSERAPDFVEALHELLEQEGWSPEEIQELIKQNVDWGQAQYKDAETVATCLGYAKDEEEDIGPFEQAQLALAVALMAQEMRLLGFGEQALVRTALNGTRDAIGDLYRLRKEEGSETGVGDLIRSRFREQLQTAMHVEARHMVQARAQEERNSRSADLLVPHGPQDGSPGDGNPNKID